MSLRDIVDFAKNDARDTWTRNVRGVPKDTEGSLDYLAGDYSVKKGLKSDKDRDELLECVKEAEKEYGLSKDQSTTAKVVSGAAKKLYWAQGAADAAWFANPLFGAPYKLTAWAGRLAADMMYAPYYCGNTGLEGIAHLPEYSVKKVIGLLPGGTLIDSMTLKDNQRWMAMKSARRKFLRRKGLYVPVHTQIANAVSKGAGYVRRLFGGEKKPDYDNELEPVAEPQPVANVGAIGGAQRKYERRDAA